MRSFVRQLLNFLLESAEKVPGIHFVLPIIYNDHIPVVIIGRLRKYFKPVLIIGTVLIIV